MTTIFDTLLDEAVSLAKSDVAGTPAVKTSAAPPGLTDLEKVSKFRDRNENIARLGVTIAKIGEFGFQKCAMEEATHGVAADTTGLPAPTTLKAVSDELKDSPANTVASDGDQPATFIAADHSETPPDVIIPKGSPDDTTEIVNGEGAQGVPGEKKDLADGSANDNLPSKAASDLSASEKIAHTLRLLSGGKRVSSKQVEYARTLGLTSPENCLEVLVKSAAHRNQELDEFLIGAELHDTSKRGLFRKFAEKTSSAAVFEDQVQQAKNVGEAALKSTGILPTARDIANAAGVDQLAATAGLYDLGEFVAAVGGRVGSAAAPLSAAMGQEAPVPGAAVPPAMTAAAVAPTPAEMAQGGPAAAPPAAPMDPMAQGGPPMDPMAQGGLAPAAPPMDPMAQGAPPMAQGAPPMDPNAVPKAAAAVSTPEEQVAAIQRFIDLRAKRSNAPVVIDQQTSGGGGPSPKEQAIDPGSSSSPEGVPEGSAKYDMSASEKRLADSLATDQDAVNTGTELENEIKGEHSQELVDTPLEGPSDHGLTSSGEPVKGTMEGNLPGSSSVGSGGGQSPSTPAVDKASGDDDGSNMLSRLRQAAAEVTAVHAKESAMMATGRGTQEIVGTSSNFTGKSDNMSTTVKRAFDFAKEHLDRVGDIPSVEDVMAKTSTTLDDAKEGISLASSSTAAS